MATVFAKPNAPASKLGTPRYSPDQYRSFANLAEAFFFNANRNFDLVAYDQAEMAPAPECNHRPRRYASTLQSTSKDRVLKIAAQLVEWGVRPQDTVAVLSLNRPEWTEAEMAIYTVGAVAVAVYVRISEERLQHILCNAGVTCAVVENDEQLTRLLQATVRAPSLKFDHSSPDRSTPHLKHVLTLEDVITPPELQRRGVQLKSLNQVLVEQPVRDERSFAFVNTQRDELASIYYTSGSNGVPTGVPVTHGQALENLYQIAEAQLIDYSRYEDPDAPQPIITLLLPERAHAFPARTAQLVATTPARARYPAIVDRKSSQVSDAYRDSLRRDLREGGAGIVPMVPKILVAIEQRVRDRLDTGGWREKLARVVIENAVRKIRNDATGSNSRMTDFLYRLMKPLRQRIVSEIRSQIVGPEFEFFISGGAKLPLETAAFLWAIHLPVYEGYGSTESNCPVATNTSLHSRLGSVGKLFSGVEARINPVDGELWLRGPNIVREYWKLGGESHNAWTEDGWYRTRDVGRLDCDGFLYIEDRVDNILVAWNGENVSAAAIEQRFCAIPCVDTVVVIGHQRPALVALVALNEDMVRRWAIRSGHSLAADWQRDPVVRAMIREQIDLHVNRRADHPCERVRHFAVIDPLVPEEQTLTATEKVRRREIERRYAAQIEQLYQDQVNWLPSFAPGPEVKKKVKQTISPLGVCIAQPFHDSSSGGSLARVEP